MRLPGDFRDEANGETSIRVSAAEGVNDEQAFAGELLSYQPFQVLQVSWDSGLLSFLPLPLS